MRSTSQLQQGTRLSHAKAAVRPPDPEECMTAADGLQSTPDDSVGTDAVLDVLMETMDAWEQAVSRRMHTAVASAVAAARKDVMQVSIVYPLHSGSKEIT